MPELPEDINNVKGRPKGVVTWRCVMREAFWYLQHAPDKLERMLGIKITKKLRKRDVQMLVILKHIEDAVDGDLKALELIMDRMDGKPNQPLEIGGEVNVNLIDVERLPIDLRRKYIAEQTDYLKKIPEKKKRKSD